ncbi:hypothetical protein [Cupriavidus nantongensis]|uniref:hypothetical protein n=1 Tax=Cupriavidus nantongensis TaxID=1796606 RepID=UPI00359007F8
MELGPLINGNQFRCRVQKEAEHRVGLADLQHCSELAAGQMQKFVLIGDFVAALKIHRPKHSRW